MTSRVFASRTGSLVVLLGLLSLIPAMAQPTSPPPPPPVQPQYQAVIPQPSMYGGYGYGWNQGASTAAGSAMNGMANVISAKGDYNLMTSEAAVNLTQAQSMEIQNRQQATDAYFSMRATNRAAREQEAGPKPTMQQLQQMAAEGVPAQLNTNQLNPVSGALTWPALLQSPAFTQQRSEVEQLMAKKASHGGLTYQEQTTVRTAIDSIYAAMKAHIKEIPPSDYVASRSFLNSVMYSATQTEL